MHLHRNDSAIESCLRQVGKKCGGVCVLQLFALATLVALLCTISSAIDDRFATLAAKADAARDAEHLDEAVSFYARALALRPSWTDGWWSLGTIYYDKDAYAKAAHAFQSLLRADPRNGTAHAMLGLCQFELGQDAAALRHIQTGLGLGLVKDESLRKVVLYHEGVLLLRQGKFGSAEDALTLLASYGADGDQASMALGMAALRILPKDLPAEGSTERGIVLQAGRAELLGAQTKFEEGGKIYAQLAADAQGFPGIHCAYGRLLLQEHLTDAAIQQFQQEIKNHPKQIQSYLEIASVQYHLDSADGAKYAEQAVELQPDLPFAHYMLGLLYADMSEYSKAIPQLELAEKNQIHEADLYYALGRAYAHTGRKAEAARARATFLRLSLQASGQEQPNIYGEHKPRRTPGGDPPPAVETVPQQ